MKKEREYQYVNLNQDTQYAQRLVENLTKRSEAVMREKHRIELADWLQRRIAEIKRIHNIK